ncbi:MAG: hypothetical protein GEV12_22985 [Micromonosporaceae bacterium]|nr:hypothetical protein [Micromonosporaceae bacterium]
MHDPTTGRPIVKQAVRALQGFGDPFTREQAEVLLPLWRHAHALEQHERSAVLAHFPPAPDPDDELTGIYRPDWMATAADDWVGTHAAWPAATYRADWVDGAVDDCAGCGALLNFVALHPDGRRGGWVHTRTDSPIPAPEPLCAVCDTTIERRLGRVGGWVHTTDHGQEPHTAHPGGEPA